MRLRSLIALASLVLLAASGAAAVSLGSTAPTAAAATTPSSTEAGVALCVLGVYNNQAGPSSGCDGVVCTGYSNEDWERCVGDCTTCDGAAGAIAPSSFEEAAPAVDDQAAICVYGDAYNTGSIRCPALVCYGQSQYASQNCVGPTPCLPPRCHIPPPDGISRPVADEQVAICVYGDAYNTGGVPCQGGVCIGYTMGHWVDCYPRMPPCLACPPPPPATRLL